MARKQGNASQQAFNEGFETMFDFWKEGQETLFRAQKQAVEAFGQSISGEGSGSQTNMFADQAKVWESFMQSWQMGWTPAEFMNSEALSGMTAQTGDVFKIVFDPALWMKTAPDQLINILENIGQGPKFADLAMPHIEAANTWREGVELQNAAVEFAKIMQDAWTRTYERFSQNFSIEDLQTGEADEALKTWLETANDELLKTQHSQIFMDAQKRLLRAQMTIKARQKDMAENWSAAFQMPTRTEVDDMAEMIYELRKEVRKLKREMAALKETR